MTQPYHRYAFLFHNQRLLYGNSSDYPKSLLSSGSQKLQEKKRNGPDKKAFRERKERVTYFLPFEANLQVMILLNEAKEVMQNGVRFVFRNTDDPFGKVWVDEDGLPTSDWVRSIRMN